MKLGKQEHMEHFQKKIKANLLGDLKSLYSPSLSYENEHLEIQITQAV